MDASLLPPVTIEVAHTPSPRADLIAGHVGPTVAQDSVARARKRRGNVVAQGGNPAAPTVKARAPGSNAAARSRSVTEKVTKATDGKSKRIPATNKPPASSSSPYGDNLDDFGAGVGTSVGGGFGGADELQDGLDGAD
ncbi:hypothetical protein D1007_34150 [Hordeum vulgare]|nr:hypothetical protein D1007_34150 [Hordeum vulgare]